MKTDCIIGISGIDSGLAVSVLEHRSIIFAIEEDKLRRFKGLGLAALEGLGSRALDMAISKVRGGLTSVDAVAYVPPLGSAEADVKSQCEFIARHFDSRYGVSLPVSPVDHVAAHLAFERAVHPSANGVLMVGHTRVVYSPDPGRDHQVDVDSSLGSILPRLARFLGLGAMQVHHLENMAQQGEPRYLDGLESLSDVASAPEKTMEEATRVTGLDRVVEGQPLSSRHFDFAASVHELLKQKTLSLLDSITGDWKGQTLATCGGVFQSWSLNDAVASRFPDTEFRVSFSPGNPACAVGGPLVLAGMQPDAALGPFLGPAYPLDEIKSILDNSKAKYSLVSDGQAIDLACEALEDGKMVGWFSGRCEYGYRALGGRSVFANPGNPYACENLSVYLKLRPTYFRYAVAMPEDRPEVAGISSPYLSRSIRLPDYFDEAVRVQTVSKSSVPTVHHLLDAFRERTEVPALLNTSLNYFEEPIACTPRDALKTFGASGLDVLVMDGFVLRKG